MQPRPTQSNNTISLNDQAAPIVTNVTSTKANGTYSTGEVIAITVTFNEVVNVMGIPQITLETGSSDAVVNYSIGTGSNTLTFNYTVAAGHTSSDLDYVATSSLALNSGTIKDAALNVATLTLASPAASGSLGANKAIVIRNDPVASNISASTIQNTNASINLVASDADFNSLTFSIVSNPSYGSVSLSGSTATYTPTANFQGTDTFTFKANDDSADSSVKTVTIKVFGNYRTTQTRIGNDIDGSGGGLLGYSLDFNEDHTIMAVGAPLSSSQAGAVKVYNWNGSAWSQLGSDINGLTGDQQGWDVSLSSDGTTLAVGAPFHETNKGTVRVYNWNGSTWSQLGIDLDGAGSGEMQGLSVSLSSNGTTLATGAPYHDFGKGTVRVYKWAGGTWSQLGIDLDGLATGDLQGQTVSLSSNGTTLATGAAGHDSAKGTVRVYNWNGSAWSQLGNEGDLDGLTGDKQGHSISLSSNGTILATGALKHDNDNKGTVRVYKWADGTWSQLGNDLDGDAEDDEQGSSVSLSSDGTILATGAWHHNNNRGRVKVFFWNGSNWTQQGNNMDGVLSWTITDDEGDDDIDGDSQGFIVSLSSNGTALTTSRPPTPNDNYNGKVLVYNLVNYIPIATAQTDVAATEQTAVTITLAGTDADGTAPSVYKIISLPTSGILSDNGTVIASGDLPKTTTAANVVYTSNSDTATSDSFTFKVNDGTDDSTAATVSLAITGVNDVPVATAQTDVAATEQTAVTITLAGTDADGTAPSVYKIISLPTSGILSDNGTVIASGDLPKTTTAANVVYTSNSDTATSDSFTFKVNDGTDDSTAATVSLAITGVNDVPVATAQTDVAATEQTAVTITLAGTDRWMTIH